MMDLQVKITMADPAGNRTAFVEGDIPADRYAAVGTALLKDPELRAEQAGFICPTTCGAIGRLQMMGGEFCGNAARSFGLLMGLRAGKGPGDTVPVEISGSSSILNVLLEENGAWISMPLPEQIIDIQVSDSYGAESGLGTTSDGLLHFPAVVLEGITHVILENVKPSEQLAHAVIEQAARVSNAEAAGAIFVTNGSMTPAVWVRDTDSFVWESSCGSGTLAATIWLGRDVHTGSYNQELTQPGGILKAGFSISDRCYTDAKLGGPVTIEEPIFKTITL